MRKASLPVLLLLCAALLLPGAVPALGQQQAPAPPADAKPVQPPPRIGDDLVGTRWQAETLEGQPVLDPASATIDFLRGDHVRGQAGCNRFVGPFASRAKRVTIGIVRQSRLKCPGEQAALQRRMVNTLHLAERAELGEGTLTLYGPKGERSRFVPRPD
jgi:heat shock protein HslJ